MDENVARDVRPREWAVVARGFCEQSPTVRSMIPGHAVQEVTDLRGWHRRPVARACCDDGPKEVLLRRCGPCAEQDQPSHDPRLHAAFLSHSSDKAFLSARRCNSSRSHTGSVVISVRSASTWAKSARSFIRPLRCASWTPD